MKFSQKKKNVFGQIFDFTQVADKPNTQEESNGCTKSLKFDSRETKPRRIKISKAFTGCTKSLKSDFPTRALSEQLPESKRGEGRLDPPENGP